MVFTAGGNVNSQQREQVVELHKAGKLRVAVLTDSQVVRGAVTAISWFGVPIAAFKPSAPERALEHLKVPPAAHAEVLARLSTIKAQVT